MGRPKIYIPNQELERLYVEELWSPKRIGELFKCDAMTVRARLQEVGVPLKTKSQAHTKYWRRDYDGTDIEKAYLLGFKYGDLNAYQPKGRSETIVLRSHSTYIDQCEVFKSLFRKYGVITTSQNGNKIQTTCYLNTSFSFLLNKYPDNIQNWIQGSPERLSAFAAGYIDAEGTFGINQGKGRFKIDSYDYKILLDIYNYFLQNELNVKFRKIAVKGENDYGWIWKEDVWRLGLNESASLERMIKMVSPYMRHKKRIADSVEVLQNIAQRRQHGSIT